MKTSKDTYSYITEVQGTIHIILVKTKASTDGLGLKIVVTFLLQFYVHDSVNV